ncbi:MAG: S-layer homology domain-containing protein [Thermotaleaceae bacterium]
MGNPRKRLGVWLAILLAIQIFPLGVYGLEDTLSFPLYEGTANQRALYSTIQFNDIQGHWARPAVQEAAALSIMRGLNNRQFAPDRTLTYAEALTVLVKAMGLEAQAQQAGEAQVQPKVRDILLMSPADDWAKGYIQVASQQGILTAQETTEILNLTQEQLERIEAQVEQQLQVYENRNLTPAESANLQRQIRDQIQSRTTWNRPVSRQQVAQWVGRALGLEPVYGDKLVNAYGFSDWQQIDTNKIPMVEAVLQKGIMSGTSATAFSPRGQLTRGQMAQLATNIHDQLLEARGLVKKSGEIIDMESLQEMGKSKRLYTIHNEDNSKNYLMVEPNSKDFIVQKNGNLGLSEVLGIGDKIRYYINEQNQILYAVVNASSQRKLEGFIDNVDGNNLTLTLTDFSDKRHLLSLQPAAQIMVNGRSAGLKDLLYGMEAVVTLQGDKVTEVEGILEEDPYRHGYISPGSRTKVGDVLFINSDTVEIKVGENREKYRITPNTQLLRSDGRANLFEIKEGDRVLLSFDDIYSADIASLQVEDQERHIDNIYRGKIESVNERGKEVLLNTVSVYQNGKWIKHPEQKIKLKVENDKLYAGGAKTSLKSLGTSKGSEIYVAVEKSYGVERSSKLLLKQGSAVLYENRISDIQFGTNRMVVDNNSFNFHPGTIVIKDNRLVDMLNLNKNQSIYMAADMSQGARNASFIAIESGGILDDRIDGTRLMVYQGSIQDIDDYGVTIGRLGYQLDYLKIQDNKWTEVSGSKKFTLTEDSFIFDSDLKKEIENRYFMDTRYIDIEDVQDKELKKRIEDDFYIGKSAYFVVKESSFDGETYGEVLALNITPKIVYKRGSVNTEHSALATIETVNLDNETITLGSLKYWNSLNKRWESASGTESVNMDKAVILLNDKPVHKDELYKLKPKAKAYVIKNKENSVNDNAYVIIVEQ